MPELAEVETIVNQLNAVFPPGSRVKSIFIPNLRFHACAEAILSTPEIVNIRRRGKYIIFLLQSPTRRRELIIHLGMTGKLIAEDIKTYKEKKHTHLAVVVSNINDKVLSFIDPRRFGKIDLTKPGVYKGLLKELGPEVFEERHPYDLVLKSKKSIKSILLEQRFIAAIGNYLADEILFEAKFSPLKKGNTFTEESLGNIVTAARAVAKRALNEGGLSFSDYQHLDGGRGNYAAKLNVYGRSGELCKICESPLSTITLATRTTVFCPRCQHE